MEDLGLLARASTEMNDITRDFRGYHRLMAASSFADMTSRIRKDLHRTNFALYTPSDIGLIGTVAMYINMYGDQQLGQDLGSLFTDLFSYIMESNSLCEEKPENPGKDKEVTQAPEVTKTEDNQEIDRGLKTQAQAKEKTQSELVSGRERILDEARKCICGHRTTDYGKPENSFGIIAGFWTEYLRGRSPDTPEISAADVTMMMALLKIARIAGGTATHDSFVDLAGYAACGGEIAEEEK